MRWDDLFDGLDRQFEHLLDAAEDAEHADRVRVTFGGVTAIERAAGSLGGLVQIRTPGDRRVTGELVRVGPDFLLLRESVSVDLLVAWSAVQGIEGLTQRTGPALGTVDTRFDLRKALRSLARDRAPVTVGTAHGTELSGTIDRVGADFCEVAAHPGWETRRSPAVRTVVLVPLAAVVLVRSAPLG